MNGNDASCTSRYCRVLNFNEHPALRERFEDAAGLLPWNRLVHFGREHGPCWVIVAGREVQLPGFWYLGDARALSHYLPLADLNKEALRAAYESLLRIIKGKA